LKISLVLQKQQKRWVEFARHRLLHLQVPKTVEGAFSACFAFCTFLWHFLYTSSFYELYLDVSIFQFFSYCLISSVFPFFAVQIDALNCYNFARNMCTITVQRKVITLQNNSNKKFKTWLIPHYLWKTYAKKFHYFMK
jgi:hypothetical protein